VQLPTLANHPAKKALPGKSKPVNQNPSEAATALFPDWQVPCSGAAKIKIVSRPNTRLVISSVATIYLTRHRVDTEKPKVERTGNCHFDLLSGPSEGRSLKTNSCFWNQTHQLSKHILISFLFEPQ